MTNLLGKLIVPINLFTQRWIHGEIIQKLKHRITTLCWNKAPWLDVASHMTMFNKSECFISRKNTYATLKCLCEIKSWSIIFVLGYRRLEVRGDGIGSALLVDLHRGCSGWHRRDHSPGTHALRRSAASGRSTLRNWACHGQADGRNQQTLSSCARTFSAKRVTQGPLKKYSKGFSMKNERKLYHLNYKMGLGVMFTNPKDTWVVDLPSGLRGRHLDSLIRKSESLLSVIHRMWFGSSSKHVYPSLTHVVLWKV